MCVCSRAHWQPRPAVYGMWLVGCLGAWICSQQLCTALHTERRALCGQQHHSRSRGGSGVLSECKSSCSACWGCCKARLALAHQAWFTPNECISYASAACPARKFVSMNTTTRQYYSPACHSKSCWMSSRTPQRAARAGQRCVCLCATHLPTPCRTCLTPPYHNHSLRQPAHVWALCATVQLQSRPAGDKDGVCVCRRGFTGSCRLWTVQHCQRIVISRVSTACDKCLSRRFYTLKRYIALKKHMM